MANAIAHFTAADGTNLNGYVDDSGNTWVAPASWEIRSNQAHHTAGTTDQAAGFNAGTADGISTAVRKAISSGNWAGVGCRWNASFTSGYAFEASGDGTTVRLRRIVSQSGTTLASASVATVAGDALTIVHVGDSLTCRVNGVDIPALSITSSTFNTNTYHGVAVYDTGAFGNYLDDFSFTAGAPAADHLAVSTQPSTPIASGAAHATQPVVAVKDVSGGTVTTDTSTVTASLVAESGSASSVGTLTKAAVSGVADFSANGLGATSAGGAVCHWHFTDGSLTGVDSSSFTVVAASAPFQVGITTQPSATYACEVVLAQQPVAAIQLADGSTDTSSTAEVMLTPSVATTKFCADIEPLVTTHTVQAGSTSTALILSPALSFPAIFGSSYAGRNHFIRAKTVAGPAGSGTVTIVSGTATFSVSQASAIINGDVVVVGGVRYTVSSFNGTTGCTLAGAPDQGPVSFTLATVGTYGITGTIASNTGTTQVNFDAAVSGSMRNGSTYTVAAGDIIEVHSGCVFDHVYATAVAGVATFAGVMLTGYQTTALVASSSGLQSVTSNSITNANAGNYDGPAELPRSVPDTSAPSITGVTVTVGPSGADYTSLQAAIDARVAADSNSNDAIVLQQGATFTGTYQLTKKATGTGWIVIKGHTDPCAEGTRVSPSDMSAVSMAVVIPSGTTDVFYCATGAHHWRLQGFEITINPTKVFSQGLVNTTDTTSEANNTGALADVPHHIVMDRLYIHGADNYDTKYGIKLGHATGGVVDCYIQNIVDRNNDNQSIVCYAGPGPYKIHNNYGEAASENILFGGSDPYVQGLVPSDITITNNHFFKPSAWGSDPAIAQKLKNIFELKNARRVLAEGNVLENNWKAAQAGDAVLLTPINQGGKAYNAGDRDITFRKNVLRNSSAGLNITNENSEQGFRSFGLRRARVYNNAVWNINDPLYVQEEFRLATLMGGVSIRVEHNTMLGSANSTNTKALVMNNPATPLIDSAYDNNLVTAESYATVANAETGSQAVTDCLLSGGSTFNNNALLNFDVGTAGSGYPASTLFPATMTAAGMATPAITSSWDTAAIDDVLAALTVTSAGTPDLRTAASDGTVVGADMTALRAAVLGTVEGTPGEEVAPAADHLALTTEPSSSTVSGIAHAVQPAGTVQDASNATVTGDTSTVTATWVDEVGTSTPSGTTSISAVAGAWAFTDLAVTGAAGNAGHWDITDGSLKGVSTQTVTIAGAASAIIAYMIYPLGA